MKTSSATIRKRTGARRPKPWVLDLRYLGGKREYYATQDEAKAARDRALIQVRNHGTQALSLSHNERIDFVRARDSLAKCGATIDQAVQFFIGHHHAIETVSFESALERIVATKTATNKDSEYVRKLELHLRSLRRSIPDKALSQISRDDIERWLYGNGWSPSTIRNLRIDIRTFFAFCSSRKWIATNPAEHIEPVQLPDSRPGILPVAQCGVLLESVRHLRSELLPFVVLNLLCGLRPEETVQLTPEQIQIDRGYVEVPATVAKSRKRRIVDLSANSAAWLAIVPFEPRDGRWYARQIIKARQDLLHDVGFDLVWPKNCLRHSFASYHLAFHGSAEKTSKQMGHHSTDMLFRHYRELVPKEEAQKFWSLAPLQEKRAPALPSLEVFTAVSPHAKALLAAAPASRAKTYDGRQNQFEFKLGL